MLVAVGCKGSTPAAETQTQVQPATQPTPPREERVVKVGYQKIGVPFLLKERAQELQKLLVAATKLPDAVIEKQLGERTDLSHSKIGQQQKDTILAAGLALQKAEVIKGDVDVKAVVDALIEDKFIKTAAK